MARAPQHVELGGRRLVVNFRFHLVSLTAVFFALALGVTVGATVLERTTVDTLESQVSRVEDRLDETDALNARLQAELERRDRFAEEVGDRLVEGRLADVPIVLVAVEGVDAEPLDSLRAALQAAGARLEGVVVFRAKIALDNEESARELAGVLGTTASRPGLLQRQLYAALTTSWATDTAHDLLVQLDERGFVDYQRLEVQDDTQTTASTEPTEAPNDRRFVVFSGEGADVANDDLAIPLTAELAGDGERLVLGAEAGVTDESGESFGAPFVAALRADASVAGVVTTVDNAGTFIGRTAAVLALADLGSGRLGHYGRGRGAESLVPPATG